MLSPYLGERMLPWRFLNSTVVLRELLPQDLKLEMDQLTRDEAISAARYLASVVGVAHASQLDRKAREEWQTVLSRNRAPKLLTLLCGYGRAWLNLLPITNQHILSTVEVTPLRSVKKT